MEEPEDKTSPTQETEGGSNEGTQTSDDDMLSDLFPEETQVDIDEVNEAIGRTGNNAFKSKADVIKWAKNVNKFVGENEYSRKAKEADEFQKAFGMSPAEYIKQNQTPQQPQRNGSENEDISSLRQDVTKMILLNEAPEAVHVLDDIRAIAKARGISEIEAYKSSESLQIAARALQRKESNKKQVTPPSARVRVGDKSVDEMSAEEIKKNYTQLRDAILSKRR